MKLAIHGRGSIYPGVAKLGAARTIVIWTKNLGEISETLNSKMEAAHNLKGVALPGEQIPTPQGGVDERLMGAKVLRNRVVPPVTPKHPRSNAHTREAIAQAKAKLLAADGARVPPIFDMLKEMANIEKHEPLTELPKELDPRGAAEGPGIAPEYYRPRAATPRERGTVSREPSAQGKKSHSNAPSEYGGEPALGQVAPGTQGIEQQMQPPSYPAVPAFGAIPRGEGPNSDGHAEGGNCKEDSGMGDEPRTAQETEKLMQTIRMQQWQMRLMAETVKASVERAFATQIPSARDQRNFDFATVLRKVPPMFDGTGATTWIMQIENYHDMVRMPQQDRVRDAVSYLSGKAINEFALARQRGKHPQTWEEFRRWILLRFRARSEAETVRRLLALEWEGSMEKLSEQFATILAEGIPPPEHETMRLFVRALPYELVKKLKSIPFGSWDEIRDFLTDYLETQGTWSTMWMASVSNKRVMDLNREAPFCFAAKLNNKTLLPRNNFAQDRKNENMGRGEMAMGQTSKLGHALSNIAPSGAKLTNNSTSTMVCRACKGVGHVAKVCPNQYANLAKEGSTCGRCKGIGHWARVCPSPPLHLGNTGGSSSKEREENPKLKGAVEAAKGLVNERA